MSIAELFWLSFGATAGFVAGAFFVDVLRDARKKAEQRRNYLKVHQNN